MAKSPRNETGVMSSEVLEILEGMCVRESMLG